MTVVWNKHRARWGYDFWRGGARYAGYCVDPRTGEPVLTKTDARIVERAEIARVEAQLKAEKALGPAVVREGFTLSMAVQEYLMRAQEENRSAFNNTDYAVELIARFGADRLLSDITAADIDDYRRWCAQQTVKKYLGGPRAGGMFRDTGRPRSNSTVNKYLIALRSAWTAAWRRHKATVPNFPLCPEINLLTTPKHLPNPVPAADIGRLLEVAPFHLIVVISLAVHTSMRLDEILALVWSEVKFELGLIILSPRTKNNEGRIVQLTATAKQLLEWLWGNRPRGEARVVLYWPAGYGEGTPKPVSSIARSWRTALKAAEISEHFRFHDLRGSMGTFLATQIAPLPLQKWLGHKDLKTTMRYIQIADASQREAATLADAYTGTSGVVARVTGTQTRERSNKEDARKFVGVYTSGRYGYQACIAVTLTENGKKSKKLQYLGSFDSAEDAARAYDVEAKKYPGRRLNFPDAANETTLGSHTSGPIQDEAPKRGIA